MNTTLQPTSPPLPCISLNVGSESDHLPEAGNNYLGSECDHLPEAGNIYIGIHRLLIGDGVPRVSAAHRSARAALLVACQRVRASAPRCLCGRRTGLQGDRQQRC